MYPGSQIKVPFAVDAFSLSWKDFKPYIFPPFSLISHIPHKLKLEEVLDAIVIAPLWPTEHCYPQLLELAVQRPVLLPQSDTLLTLLQEDVLHPPKDVMRLVAWHVSGISWRSEEFLRGQPAMCSSPGVPELKTSTLQHGGASVAGLRRNRQILFKQNLGTVCDFLTDHFEVLNKSYSTINSYRSALSSMLLPVDGYALGEHPIIVNMGC